MKEGRIKETIGLAGSVASITGVSLLWFQSFSPSVNLLVAVPILAIAGLLVIGLLAFAWLTFRVGYIYADTISKDTSLNTAVNIAYFGLVGAALMLLLVIAIAYIYIFTSLALHEFTRR
jgi:hypothetical protein